MAFSLSLVVVAFMTRPLPDRVSVAGADVTETSTIAIASLPSAPSEAVAPVTIDRMAVGALYGECMEDTASPIGEPAVGTGTGPTVGVIGDSITSQVRDQLLADPSQRWVIWSRCGATTASALAAGAVAAVMALHPVVLIVALGTNDAGFPDAHPGASTGFAERARQILAAVTGTRCVIWVNVAQTGDPTLHSEMQAVNAVLGLLPGVHVADWQTVVDHDAAALTDRVHLSSAGLASRVGLLERAVGECAAPSATGP